MGKSIGRSDIIAARDIETHSIFRQYGMRSGSELNRQYNEQQNRDDAIQAAQDADWNA